MKLLFKNKKTSIFLKDDEKILKIGSIGKNEVISQKKAHELGIAPCVYNYDKSSIEMEYIKGYVLEEYLKKNNIDRQSIMKKTTDAENLLYDNGINHRDLSGKNIIITHDESVKIIDYGFSIITDCPVPRRERTYYHFLL